MNSTHVDEERLSEYAAGALPADAAKTVAHHLENCADCAVRHEQVAALLYSKTVAPPPSRGPNPTNPDRPAGRESSGLVLQKGATFDGRYVLIERLGAGGMGEVFAAYDPKLDRKIALKLLRPGSFSKDEGRARLEREAQSMARLSHPNVVTVFDVGQFQDRLFVAMEFVEGETLTDWLRGNRKWQEVVRLFLQAGNGLAAAHSSGIVHRDFKPDNVLIGRDNRPRVMDFGLARASSSAQSGGISNPNLRPVTGVLPPSVEASLEGPSLVTPITRDGAVMGTPGYMAPEQLSGLPIDARSDQFSFCVTLFEALYGTRPFGGSTLRTHRDEIMAGKFVPIPTGSSVPGYVDAAIRRGLRAQPEDRWASMAELLAALRPKATQNLRRMFVALVVLSVLATVAVALAIASTRKLQTCAGFDRRLDKLWDRETKSKLKQAFLATHAPFVADSWRTVEGALDTWTQDWVKVSTETCELAKVKRVDNEELHQLKVLCLDNRLSQLKATENLLESADVEVITNAVTMVRGLQNIDDCRNAAELLRHEHPQNERGHLKEEALMQGLFSARALHDAGKYAKGIEVIKAALAESEGAPPGPLAEARLLLARLQDRAGDAHAAEATLELALLDAERSGEAQWIARAYSRDAMVNGSLLHRFDDAHRLEALAQAAASRIPQDKEIEAELSSNVGQVALQEGKWEQAKDAFENALTLNEQALGPEHPEVGRTLNNLGMALAQLGKYKEATAAYERSVELHRRNVGANHPDTANSLTNLAVIYRREGRLSEAYTALDDALKVRRETLGEEHPEVASGYLSRGKLLVRLNKPDDALDDFQHALTIRMKRFGPEDPQVAAVYDDLAQFYLERGFGKEALSHAQLALAIDEKALGPEHISTTYAREKVGKAYGMLGQWTKAEAELNQTLEARKARRGADAPEVAGAFHSLGDLQLSQGKAEKALGFYEQAVAVREKANGPTDQALAGDLEGAGHALIEVRQPEKALPLLRRAVGIREKGEDPAELASARFQLARALYDASPDDRIQAFQLASTSAADLPASMQDTLNGWLKTHPLPAN